MKLQEAERRELLARARRAIAAAIRVDEVCPLLEDGVPAVPALMERRSGAFVSLHIRGDLRGCIGYPATDLPLAEVVERCAVSSATSDPRFPALTPEEWPDAVIEISVLGPIERVTEISEVEVGRHGLIAELGPRRGLLLPQVATEWGWDRLEFAARTCVKAGLPRDAWRQGASLFKFEAEVFSGP